MEDKIIAKYLPDLISASLEKDLSKVEVISLSIARIIKKDYPQVASKLNLLISSHSLHGFHLRGINEMPLPVDQDTQLTMVDLLRPSLENTPPPILNNYLFKKISGIIEEREKASLLIDKGIRPSSGLLIIGPPGTGKTMLAYHFAARLKKDLIVLDLSSSISSLLGKTVHNLKKVMQYAKENSAILLLDEFDAIAKRRDDSIDLGEMKRVVNVLLMELEQWPISSMVIATSNHPELIDKAIWRRFDHILQIGLPEKKERTEILKDQFTGYFENERDLIFETISEMLEGKSASDITRFATNVKRRSILDSKDLLESLLIEFEELGQEKLVRGKFSVLAKEIFGSKITVREIGKITGLSPAGVQHHINKSKKMKNGRKKA